MSDTESSRPYKITTHGSNTTSTAAIILEDDSPIQPNITNNAQYVTVSERMDIEQRTWNDKSVRQEW